MRQETRHEPIVTEAGVSVIMVRDHLNEIPSHPLSDGYTIRWYQPGDEDHWLRIHEESEGYENLSPDLFGEQFGGDPELLAARIAFVCGPDGLPVSTNAAWMNDWNGEDWGRVHWVATSRSEQGKGLSKPLMTAVCERLRELGHDRAYLTTNTVRARAIALYAAFGFRAYWETQEHEAAWVELGRELAGIGKSIEI